RSLAERPRLARVRGRRRPAGSAAGVAATVTGRAAPGPRRPCAGARGTGGPAPAARLVGGRACRVDGPRRHRPLPREPGWLLAAPRADGSDRAAGARRCNDFLTEQLSGHADRLHAVAVLDLTDLDAAVAELERARARGARAFFIYTVKGGPPGPLSPGHPTWDRVWAAAAALGMVAVGHVGDN